MSSEVFNKREKLAPPPFITVPVEDEGTRRKTFDAWSTLKKCNCVLEEKTTTFASEGELLRGFITRKGTQLRLEKALMLSRRILTLVLRWKSNTCWDDFTKFGNVFNDTFTHNNNGKKQKAKELKKDPKKRPSTKMKKTVEEMEEHVKGNNNGKMKEAIRLPSRQWSNWVIYLTLRDLLLLSKVNVCFCCFIGYTLS